MNVNQNLTKIDSSTSGILPPYCERRDITKLEHGIILELRRLKIFSKIFIKIYFFIILNDILIMKKRLGSIIEL